MQSFLSTITFSLTFVLINQFLSKKNWFYKKNRKTGNMQMRFICELIFLAANKRLYKPLSVHPSICLSICQFLRSINQLNNNMATFWFISLFFCLASSSILVVDLFWLFTHFGIDLCGNKVFCSLFESQTSNLAR